MRSRSNAFPAVVLAGACWLTLKNVGLRTFAHGPELEKETLYTEQESLQHVDLAVACMLLGGISFVMGLFYLVNHHDADVRRYTWEVISTTIAIFTSVLIFESMDGVFIVVARFFTNSVSTDQLNKDMLVVTVDMVHVLIWFIASHLIIARAAYRAKAEGKVSDDMAQEIRCWATLLGHMTAFAAIATWCDVGLLPAFAANPFTSVVPIFGHLAVLVGLFRSSQLLRHKVGKAEWVELWEEEGEEAENDLAALSTSYLVVQTVRYFISGVLGNESGSELDGTCTSDVAKTGQNERRGLWCILKLLSASAVFLALMYVMVWLLSKRRSKSGSFVEDIPSYHSKAGLDSWRRYAKRWAFILLDAFGMAFAWSLLYSCKWFLRWLSEVVDLPLLQTTTISSIFLALVTSFMSGRVILWMNWIADHRKHDLVYKECRTLIRSMGLLIGFAWEQTFKAGVEAVADLTTSMGFWVPLLAKLVLGSMVGMVVIPAWRLYILKTVLAMRKEH